MTLRDLFTRRPAQTHYYPDDTRFEGGRLHLDGAKKRAVEVGRARLIVTSGAFLLAFAVIGARMVDVTVVKGGDQPRTARSHKAATLNLARADITDRNGILLATSLPTMSVYAKPKEIIDPAEAARKLASVLPELNQAEVKARLASERGFVYLKRNLTPRQQYEVNALGIPGIYFEKGERRVYPQGQLAAHVVGLTDVDGKGVAGIEKTFDQALAGSKEPIKLAIDVRIQTIVRNELIAAIERFKAVGATGMVLDVHTGELVSMVSLPDFDPNQPGTTTAEAMFNRATLGVYEMGSTFKLFNTAIALDTGASNMSSAYDPNPIQVARFTITDTHPLRHPMSVSDILIHSSNIGSAKMALDFGIDAQKNYMARFGMLRPASIELPEVGAPLVPSAWREINAMTIAFGHGIAVTPIQMVSGVGSLVNGGVFRPTTLLKQPEGAVPEGKQILKAKTSEQMRHLMRLVVEEGTGSKADVPGYSVGGKTGTAEKAGAGGYRKKAVLSSFISTFPTQDPKYVVLVMIDEPQGTKETYGFITAGWNAAPTNGRIIAQIAPLLGLPPEGVADPQMVQTISTKEPKLAETE